MGDLLARGLAKDALNAISPYQSLPHSIGTLDVSTAPMIAMDSTRVDGTPCTGTGILNSITLRANAVGNLKVKFFRQFNTYGFEFKKEVEITTKSGLYTYYAGIDFTPFEVEQGWVIGVYSSGSPAVPYISTPGVGSSFSLTGDAYGTVVVGGASNYRIAISASIGRSLEDTIEGMQDEIDLLKGTSVTSTLMSTTFEGTTLSADYSNTGFVINNGATSPTVGGWDKQLYWNKYSSLDRSRMRVKVILGDTNCDIGICRRSKFNLSSSLADVDFVNSKLQLRGVWDNNVSTIPDVTNFTAIPFATVVGREYLIEFKKETVDKVTLKLTDTITGDTVEISNTYSVSLDEHGSMLDSPCVIAVSGDFTVTKMEYVSDMPTSPKLAIYGDSFIEGSTLLSLGIANRYAAKLSTLLSDDCIISGRGGDSSTELKNKFDVDFMNFKPKYTMLAIGANDSSFATWLANMHVLITKVESRGSIPILVTVTKRTDVDRTAVMTAINNWILASGYKYVDANFVTTTNNDRQTQNATFFLADGIHPNVEGHDIIYKRALVDVPEVFDF